MTFRGFFALNNVEFANSSRVVAHLGRAAPTSDYGYFASAISNDCALTPTVGYTGLFQIPSTSVELTPGLYSPPNGARRYGPGIYEVGDCWGPAAICGDCRTGVLYDDTWDELATFRDDGDYRPELAPWYTVELPESGEFGGVWVMDVTGLDSTPIQRNVVESVGSGGVASRHRDTTRTMTFDALLIACTNAGVQYGLNWLTCLLRETSDNVTTTLRYLSAHPGGSSVDPDTLVRDMHNVVLTRAPEVTEAVSTGDNPQANMYRISWEMAALSPYAYLPAVTIAVEWDRITRQPINWIHAADCKQPEMCVDIPVLFSTECVPETIEVVTTPPPVCGGCMPVSGLDKYVFQVPTQEYAFRCRETAVSMVVTNTGELPITLQGFWRICGTDIRCEDNQWPIQISGLEAGAELHLDGVTGRYWAWYDERVRRPVGVVGTPTGAPWRPPIIDRQLCWEFVVQAAASAEFEISMSMSDRDP